MSRRGYRVLVLFLLILNAAGFWYSAVHTASRPYELDYGEGIVLYQASKITDLRFAYKPIDNYPFVVFHYPPVYHLTVLIFATLTGSLLAAGRYESLVSGALIELMITLLV